MQRCWRCGDQTFRKDGTCASCALELDAKAAEGIRMLEDMLAAHARFDEWERDPDRQPSS